MNLEGPLDSFRLPDILTLLATTGKTGALHLSAPHRPEAVIWLADGDVCGASCDLRRPALVRRLSGAGLLDDAGLRRLLTAARQRPGVPLAVLVGQDGGVRPEELERVSAEAATDAVCELLGWNTGGFAFALEEAAPGPVRLAVVDLIAEGSRRERALRALAAQQVLPGTVLALTLEVAGEVALTAEEWRLTALIDGHHSVGELAVLLGYGEFRTAGLVAGLMSRGLVAAAGEDGGDVEVLLERARLLRCFDQIDESAEHPPPPAPPAAPTLAPDVAPVPLAEPAAPPPLAEPAAPPPLRLLPEVPTARDGEGDGEINRSLLLRLIAGVQGL